MPRSALYAVVMYLSGPECLESGGTARRPDSAPPPDAPALSADASPNDGAEAAADVPPVPAPDAAPADAGPPDPVAGLRSAVEAFGGERWAEAQAGFRAARERWPTLTAELLYYELESAYRAGARDDARVAADALRAAGGRYAVDAEVRLADLAFDDGQWTAAADAYRPLAERRLPRRIDKVALRFRLARALEAQGDRRRARPAYEQLLREEPDHPEAAQAEARLQALDPEFTVPAAWRLERARTLVERREWAAAIDEIDRIPAGTRTPPPEEVAFERARAIYQHRRRYDESAEAFAAVAALAGPHAAEAAYLRARSLSRAWRNDEAIAAYRDYAERFPQGADVVDARYLAAMLELQLGRTDDAIRALEELVGRNRRGPGRPQSRWGLALAYLLADRFADALPLIEGTEDEEEDSLSKGRVLYWTAVARAGSGERDAALTLFRELLARYPLHYYAFQARQRLLDLGETPPPPFPTRLGGRSDLRERCGALPEEVDLLRRAGLRTDARERLLDAVRGDIPDADGEPLRELTGRLLCVDAVDVVHRHVLSAHLNDWGVPLDERTFPFWEAAYPRGYRERVQADSDREGISPYLIWSIMRQESSFESNVVSPADAIGLLQMIPPTTQRILAARGETYRDGMLFDPDVNIDLGIHYIAWIGRKFHGQLPLIAAAYNGGPHNVAHWLDDTRETRLDFFVERIPFEQTRNYVRRVTTSYARYLYLYETDGNDWPFELPATLRLDYEPEPSF